MDRNEIVWTLNSHRRVQLPYSPPNCEDLRSASVVDGISSPGSTMGNNGHPDGNRLRAGAFFNGSQNCRKPGENGTVSDN